MKEVKGEDEEDYPNKDTPIPEEIKPVPDSEPTTQSGPDYMYEEYYRIPNYQNKYNTQDLLVIGRSKIEGAGLGLFAFVPLETRTLPENKQNWIKIDKKLRSTAKSLATNKYRVFKGITPLSKKSTYIDEYLGEYITASNPQKLHKILDRTKTEIDQDR